MQDERSQGRLRWLGIAAALILALVLIILESTGNLGSALSVIEGPLTSITSWSGRQAQGLGRQLALPSDLEQAQQETVALRAEVARLEREIQDLSEIQGEYQILQDLFDRARETPYFSRITANVIAYDTSPLFRSLVLDRGSDDGVEVGMPVESPRGLVGQVFRTTKNSAQVLMVTDNVSSIPGRLGRSRATGVVRGGGLGEGLTMGWIDLEAQIEPGEVVYTSGLGGRFPQDMVIGRVASVEKREADLFQLATVVPAVDFDSLETLFVITDFIAIDTTLFDSLDGD